MKLGREIGFLLSLVAGGLLLHLVAYDESKVALHRMDIPLRQDRGFADEISTKCRVLFPRQEGRVEKFFLERLSPSVAAVGTEPCLMTVAHQMDNRFSLRTQWNFLVHVRAEDTGRITSRNYLVEFPRPLVLLPLVAFLLALVFEVKFWGLGWTLVTFLFLLGGANAIHGLNLSLRSTGLAITTEPTFPGLLLILLWLALYRNKRGQRPIARGNPSPYQSLLNRLLTLTVGLWNPAVYSLGGRVLFPFRGVVSRLIPFLDAQFFVLCLSLYLLSVDIKYLKDIFDKSLFLPRYFSFATLLFFGISYWPTRSRRQVILWQLPRFWASIGAVAAVELVALRVPAIKELPTLVRVGTALCLSELAWPVRISFLAAAREFLPWAGTLLVTTFITVMSQESGVKDLVMVLLEPRMHPSVIVLFTFLSGLGLGFVTGSFSMSFFALFTTMIRAQEEPLLRAALLDGILAGSLLSPFSLYNLMCVALFDLKLQQLLGYRFRQLAFPLVIGGAIFAVSSINSVAILQPVTFIFMCLLVLSVQLRKSSWHLRGLSLTGHSGQR